MAYHAGVLLSLQHHLGFEPNDADVIVGTSAGSIMATMVRLGFRAEDLAAFVVGAPFREEWTHAEETIRASMAHPHRRRIRNLLTPPSPLHLLGVLRSVGRTRASVVLAGLLNGAVDIRAALAILDELGPAWPERPTRIVAVGRDGRRVVFGGRDGNPPLSLAVAASCAIPGVFAPVRIGRRSYIDGGAHSPTNADVVRDLRPAHVLVVSPMSCEPGAAGRRVDGPLRARFRRRLHVELARLAGVGTTATIIEPRRDELAVTGLNLMDQTGAVDVLREAFLATGDRIAAGELRWLEARVPVPAA
jgi:NTE family protein